MSTLLESLIFCVVMYSVTPAINGTKWEPLATITVTAQPVTTELKPTTTASMPSTTTTSAPSTTTAKPTTTTTAQHSSTSSTAMPSTTTTAKPSSSTTSTVSSTLKTTSTTTQSTTTTGSTTTTSVHPTTTRAPCKDCATGVCCHYQGMPPYCCNGLGTDATCCPSENKVKCCKAGSYCVSDACAPNIGGRNHLLRRLANGGEQYYEILK